MSQKYHCPVILTRTKRGVDIKHVSNECLKALSKYTLTTRIVIDARNELTPDNPYAFVVFTEDLDVNWLSHKVFKNRSEIFSSDIMVSKSPQDIQEIYFVYGDISFSKNRNKITAIAPLVDEKGNPLAISTDTEILEHIFKKYKKRSDIICWYYDSEKN